MVKSSQTLGIQKARRVRNVTRASECWRSGEGLCPFWWNSSTAGDMHLSNLSLTKTNGKSVARRLRNVVLRGLTAFGGTGRKMEIGGFFHTVFLSNLPH